MTKLRLPKPFWLKLLLTVVLLEIFLGGGGRLIDTGAMSIRIFLFIITLFLGLILAFALKGTNRNFLIILGISTFVFVFSSLIGYINGASLALIANDIKPLLSIYSLLFFSYAIRNADDIHLVSRLIRFSAIVLALSYVGMVVMLNSQVVNFEAFYSLVTPTNEFFFRNDYAFFYKGFIYICIGLLFYVTAAKKNYKVMALLIVAIILTFTRGFVLSLLLVYLFYITVILRRAVRLIIVLTFLTVAGFFAWENITNPKEANKEESDSSRLTQIEEVFESTTVASVFIGHGYGIGVPSRPERMEIAFLEIFHKQGIIGLSLWILILVYCWGLYKVSVRNGYFRTATPYILSVILVYVESFTNPYLNNPIGLTMVLVSIVALNILSHKHAAVSLQVERQD